MAGNKYIALSSGQWVEVEAIQSSAGAGDAGKIPALDSSGRLDATMMPVGIGADTASIPTSENLAAGDFINLYDNSGTLTARKADASNGRRADGFVLAAVTSPANATVYFEGQNTQLSSLTLGAVYYLSGSVAGAVTATAPSTATHLVQELGKAISATALSTEIGRPVTLA